MKICPSCREEFLDHIARCNGCHVDLVLEHQVEEFARPSDLLSKNELLESETAAFVEGSLTHCREIEKILLKSLVSCAVYPLSLGCDDDHKAALGASCDKKYVVLIRVVDVDKAKLALEGQFSAQVAKEGRGQFVTGAIDLAHDVVTCPACGETNPLKEGECPVCGLVLGMDNVTEKINS